MGIFDDIKAWAQELSDRGSARSSATGSVRRRGETTVRVLPFGGSERQHLEVMFPNSLSDPDHPFVFDGDLGGLLDDDWTTDPDTTEEVSETVENGMVTRTTVFRSADRSRVLRRVDRHTEHADETLAAAIARFRERYPSAVVDGDHVEIDLDLDAPTDQVVGDMQQLARDLLDGAHMCTEHDESPSAPPKLEPPVAPAPTPTADGLSLDEADVLAAVFDASMHVHERRTSIVPNYVGQTITWSVEVETNGRAGNGAKIDALIGHVGDTGRYSDRVRGEILTAAPVDVQRGDEITVRAVIGAIDLYRRHIELLDADVLGDAG